MVGFVVFLEFAGCVEYSKWALGADMDVDLLAVLYVGEMDVVLMA